MNMYLVPSFEFSGSAYLVRHLYLENLPVNDHSLNLS